MIITIPEKVRWVKNVPTDPLESYSSKKRKRLRQLREQYSDIIQTSIEPLTAELLTWFEPLYKKTISEKNNAQLFDISAKTIDSNNGKKYLALVISENGERIGASIFSQLPDRINVAFRIFPQSWSSFRSDASPTLYSDWVLSEYALKQSITTMSHGKDRNPYGPNADIGLALFKLSVSCKPSIPNDCGSTEFDVDHIIENTLLLLQPSAGTSRITKSILVCDVNSAKKYEPLSKYPELMEVEIITKDTF